MKEDFSKTNINELHPSFFTNNKNHFFKSLSKIKDLESNSILILKGGDEIPRYSTDTVNYNFLQDSNFYYLTGVNSPGFHAIYDLSYNEITLYFNVPHPKDNEKDPRVYSNIPSLIEIERKYYMKCYDILDLYKNINLRKPSQIYFLFGTNSDSNLEISSGISTFQPTNDYKTLLNLVSLRKDLYETLADCRSVKLKTEYEVISYTVNETVRIHNKLLSKIRPNLNERDLENAFYEESRKLYCRERPYFPIVSSQTSNVHYHSNDKVISDCKLIMIDAGIRIGNYCSDLTMTVPINGKFTQKQKDIYNLVLAANRQVLLIASEKKTWLELHLECELVLIKGLISLGLLNDYNPEEIRQKRVCSYFMYHGLGHFIGLEMHDVGGYLSFLPSRPKEFGLSSLRTTRQLKAGNVITVEPGIYFNMYLIEKGMNDSSISKYFNRKKIEEYKEVGGVRIEDMVFITENSCVLMSSGLKRTVEEIEEAMRK